MIPEAVAAAFLPGGFSISRRFFLRGNA